MDVDQPGIKATERSFRIIEAIRDDPGASLGDLARTVDVSKSGVYKHVQSLLRTGYVVREGDRYYLSATCLSLGFGARSWLDRPAIRRVVTNLASTSGHTASFVLAEPERGVYLVRTGESPGGRVIVPGHPAPFHATAGGKAIFSFLPQDRRQAILGAGGFDGYTDKTMTDPSVVERALTGIRDRKIAFDRGEHGEGMQSVAAPVVGPDGIAVGAVSVAGPATQLSGKRLEEDAAGLVTSAGTELERVLLSG